MEGDMKKVIWVFVLCLGIAGMVKSGMAEDRYALSFDGVDDYATTEIQIGGGPCEMSLLFWLYVPRIQLSGEEEKRVVIPLDMIPKGKASEDMLLGPKLYISVPRKSGSWITASVTTGKYKTESFVQRKMKTGFSDKAEFGYNRWHHFAITVGGMESHLYIDGKDVDSASFPRVLNPDVSKLTIGRTDWGGGKCYFKGQMAQLMIFQRRLDQATIRSIMAKKSLDPKKNAPGQEAEGLICYWSFNMTMGDVSVGRKKSNLSRFGSEGPQNGPQFVKVERLN